CLNIGVLPVQVSPEFLEKIFRAIEADPNALLEANLPEQTLTIKATGEQESFDINAYKKANMLHGFDDIDYLLNIKEQIREFAEDRPL
ncbi:MAG TPA: 3-isopropylmalate dehydratase small subunit, partial [Pricia sp.]|nr:3-isopropylmalate dehydratase small subunit [Pricia sp.]